MVIQKGNKIVGLVYPDYDEARNIGINDDDIAKIMEQNRIELNSQLPAYCRISEIKLTKEEFEKTPKKSIKRYLYVNA